MAAPAGLRVAVAGGTGVVGRHVVATLSQRGDQPVVLARSAGIDVLTGTGLAAALDGVDCLIDVLNVATMRRTKSVHFFETTTRRLLEEGRHAGVRHHVVLSIVGIDEVDYGYYEGKRRQEQLALGSGLPVSVLRATQFHEFADQVIRPLGPLRVVPRMRVQPVAAIEVAQALVEIAAGDPVGRAPDLAGPRVHELPDLSRRLLRAQGQRQVVVGVPVPGKAGRQMADGGLLPQAGARTATTSFDDWLATVVR